MGRRPHVPSSKTNNEKERTSPYPAIRPAFRSCKRWGPKKTLGRLRRRRGLYARPPGGSTAILKHLCADTKRPRNPDFASLFRLVKLPAMRIAHILGAGLPESSPPDKRPCADSAAARRPRLAGRSAIVLLDRPHQIMHAPARLEVGAALPKQLEPGGVQRRTRQVSVMTKMPPAGRLSRMCRSGGLGRRGTMLPPKMQYRDAVRQQPHNGAGNRGRARRHRR